MTLPRFVLCLAASLATLTAAAQAPEPAGSPERGYKAYMDKMCFTCHGTVGQGGERGSGPQIAPSQWPHEAFVQQVRHPRQAMPRYPAKYTTDQDLADMHAYLRSIKPWRAAKDIELLSKAP